jgi:hypothetical protein
MARYLLVQVDRNDTADRLRDRLDAVAGLKVIGMFAKPTQFCECEEDTGRSVRGSRFGWSLCPNCKKPKTDALQSSLPNLDEQGIPAQYQNIFLTIREPYLHPMKRTGPVAIATRLQQITITAAKNARRQKRRPRARR